MVVVYQFKDKSIVLWGGVQMNERRVKGIN